MNKDETTSFLWRHALAHLQAIAKDYPNVNSYEGTPMNWILIFQLGDETGMINLDETTKTIWKREKK